MSVGTPRPAAWPARIITSRFVKPGGEGSVLSAAFGSRTQMIRSGAGSNSNRSPASLLSTHASVMPAGPNVPTRTVRLSPAAVTTVARISERYLSSRLRFAEAPGKPKTRPVDHARAPVRSAVDLESGAVPGDRAVQPGGRAGHARLACRDGLRRLMPDLSPALVHKRPGDRPPGGAAIRRRSARRITLLYGRPLAPSRLPAAHR